jgi:hypothetical protein
MRTAALILLAGALACFHTRSGVRDPLPTSGGVRVARAEAAIAFPRMTAADWSCSYRRYQQPDLRLYSWTVNVSGREGPWYVIDVWPALPESLARSRPGLEKILAFAQPVVGIAGGEPPINTQVIDRSPTARMERGQVVIRVNKRSLVRRLFRSRPDSVRLVACLNGNDSWTQVLPIDYR